jgi:PAS domain S-box-containing protein
MRFEASKVIENIADQVADNTNVMLAYWDKDLICRYANKAYLYWFGVDPVNMINKMHIKELLGPLYESNLHYINDTLNGKISVFERYITLPNGARKKTRANYIPHIDNGEIIGFYVSVLDISIINEKPIVDKSNVFNYTIDYLQPSNDVLEDVVKTLKLLTNI